MVFELILVHQSLSLVIVQKLLGGLWDKTKHGSLFFKLSVCPLQKFDVHFSD